MTTRRWLFADQLGPHFLDDERDDVRDDERDHEQPVLLVESRAVFRRRRFHRQKAHLVLSALRHRARELGDRATFVQADTYGEALDSAGGTFEVCAPTSWAARDLVGRRPDVTVLPARGFVTSEADFAAWAEGRGRRRLLLEDFYRAARRRHGVLVEGREPVGGQWNFDHDNREPPPKAPTLDVPPPWRAEEDEVDEEVRADLDRWARAGDVGFVGEDRPRWAPATAAEAEAALADFVAHRLPTFGRWEDAMLADDPTMSHSLLSPALNLGLLDPLDVVRAAEAAHGRGDAPLASVEGFVRQVLGWRDYVWHLYWHLGRRYRSRNALRAQHPVPDWLWELDAGAVTANCLAHTLDDLRERGWVHHIPRLMVLGGWALQRGIHPAELTTWFHQSFVDGYDWVMVPNVVGMSQHADGGLMATKPYLSGGAYLDRMSDYCGGCAYDPKARTGPKACPYTAGYWAFLRRHRRRLEGNARMRQPLRGLDRLADLDEVAAAVRRAGTSPP